MVSQSGSPACASRSAAASARRYAARSTRSRDVSYSSAYSSAINVPTCNGLFHPGRRPRVLILLVQHRDEQAEEARLFLRVVRLPHPQLEIGHAIGVELTDRARS